MTRRDSAHFLSQSRAFSSVNFPERSEGLVECHTGAGGDLEDPADYLLRALADQQVGADFIVDGGELDDSVGERQGGCVFMCPGRGAATSASRKATIHVDRRWTLQGL